MKKIIILMALLSTVLYSTNNQAANVGSGFNYQGQLDDNGAPANGSYNFAFLLFDALINGNQIGSSVIINASEVVNGLINVENIDFGDAAYTGQELWLQITVEKVGVSNSAEILSPRQRLASVPYAVQAQFLDGNGSSAKDFLKSNGSEWVAGPLATGASTGDYLQYIGSDWVAAPLGVSASPWIKDGSTINYTAGKVGVGVNALNTFAKLHVDSSSLELLRLSDNSAERFSVANDGTAKFDGDTKQNASSEGMVKYMVYVNCAGNSTSILRFYNATTTVGDVTLSPFTQPVGQCALRFPSTINNRYWAVTASSVAADRSAKCYASSANELTCNRIVASSGLATSGSISVIVY